jgi:hypothetical protein
MVDGDWRRALNRIVAAKEFRGYNERRRVRARGLQQPTLQGLVKQRRAGRPPHYLERDWTCNKGVAPVDSRALTHESQDPSRIW